MTNPTIALTREELENDVNFDTERFMHEFYSVCGGNLRTYEALLECRYSNRVTGQRVELVEEKSNG